MLNGLDPIIIFQFTKLLPRDQELLSKIPLSYFNERPTDRITFPPIPIYLSERLTGLYIVSEDKTIDIQTSVEPATDGTQPTTTQKSINSIVRINMRASRDSIGLTLLSSVADLLIPKVTAREYEITYLNGPVTVFGGVMNSFQVTQNSNNTLYEISVELVRTRIQTNQVQQTVVVERVANPVPVN